MVYTSKITFKFCTDNMVSLKILSQKKKVFFLRYFFPKKFFLNFFFFFPKKVMWRVHYATASRAGLQKTQAPSFKLGYLDTRFEISLARRFHFSWS